MNPKDERIASNENLKMMQPPITLIQFQRRHVAIVPPEFAINVLSYFWMIR
ncbi:hypothetical protein PGTUg99_002254 [Puccinia graminis f. sp. tritici]|uniref:Uncharacterized protein n=1 Tax=Puccinia graminis f. sp. tritici TaxID=56615 RepID=A0A5B0P5W6_PUCGR|nr:hypothetical protein PGTUg99_002254 [Puccinia graminis f. sp. tritici]